MNAPILEFVRAYAGRDPVRFHMPGHKGRTVLGPEALDITEVPGADVLSHAAGIIRESENNARKLFGTGATFYSTEGSSLGIRAMLYLALLQARRQGRPARILAGRNAHRTFLSAAALLELEVEWLAPIGTDLLSCPIGPQDLDRAFKGGKQPVAVYITTPDYLGGMVDIKALAQVCHENGVLLLVDNAHGAYLHFLPTPLHPMDLGADACCDSAHKTLPVLTGGAYLHISKAAPPEWREEGERALALFASTSPSYLILQSMDAANLCLERDFPRDLAAFLPVVEGCGRRLAEGGWTLFGEEPLKLTLLTKGYGYEGGEAAEYLSRQGISVEFADRDAVVLMPAPAMGAESLARLEKALLGLPRRAGAMRPAPALPQGERVLSLRQALLAPQELLAVEECEGRILGDPAVSCPPAVPIVLCGERITPQAVECLRYYGITHCWVVRE